MILSCGLQLFLLVVDGDIVGDENIKQRSRLKCIVKFYLFEMRILL